MEYELKKKVLKKNKNKIILEYKIIVIIFTRNQGYCFDFDNNKYYIVIG